MCTRSKESERLPIGVRGLVTFPQPYVGVTCTKSAIERQTGSFKIEPNYDKRGSGAVLSRVLCPALELLI